MRSVKLIIGLFIIWGLATLLAGCGGGSSGTPILLTTTPTTPTTTSTYLVEYVPGTMSEAVGKTTFKLKVQTRSTSAAANGLTIGLKPVMHMTSGSTHSTPVDSIVDNGDGTYTCTVYYLMMSSASMGYWNLDVTIGSETTTFTPTVGMGMGVEIQKLYGTDDSMMNAANPNKYYLFTDGSSAATNSAFKLYITHGENMMDTFVPAALNSMMASPTGGVNAISIEVSAGDKDFGAGNTVTFSAANLASGHWAADWSSLGLTAGAHNDIYVRMSVNGQDKTRDGGAATNANSAAFNVTIP